MSQWKKTSKKTVMKMKILKGHNSEKVIEILPELHLTCEK